MYQTEILRTADGSDTIYVTGLDEHFHSVFGAMGESEHVFINNGFDFSKTNPLRILEVGFGTGLNVLLTALRNLSTRREIHYTALEKFPLSASVIDSLNYRDIVSPEGKDIFSQIHLSPWNAIQEICNNFFLEKLTVDLVTDRIPGSYDLIYFDAFSPDKQPEMWSKNVFSKISEVTSPNGILVTYSAKGEVKRILRRLGFIVSLLPGYAGKRHMIRAVKF
jgi:tRNA U34 5-methylaminomethyl-2-thiouridine-forming methyltransferase MnmC